VPSHNQRHAALIILFMLLAILASAQTFTVIHTFTGSADGGYPYAGLVVDQSGNLYGTANVGGRGTCPPQNIGCGTVFKMAKTKSGWTFQRLYAFRGGNDGQGPYGPVTLRPDGSLYGSTVDGGNDNCPSGCGLVYVVKPPAASCETACGWTESVLYRFQGNTDGFYPIGAVTFDSAGNLYGTTEQGGSIGPGTVYELKPSGSKWTESIIWNFTGNDDGGNPYNGVTLDGAGKIFGTTLAGGVNNSGSVFELTRSGHAWTETTVHDFYGSADGIFPLPALIVEKSGKLIGATAAGGTRDGGTVYSLTPSKSGWTLKTLYDLPGPGGEPGPWAKLTMDAAGNLFGTTQGYPPAKDYGTVFKLTHTSSGWKYTLLYHFTGGSDGEVPYSTLVFGPNGKLYGTTQLSENGAGYGTVFEITP